MLRFIFCFVFFFTSSSVVEANNLYSIRDLLYPLEQDVRTDTFLLEKDSNLIIEDYKRGYDKSSKHLSWSMAKTVSALLIGRAEKLGYLKIHEPVKKYIPSFQTDATILDVLQMSSGIRFNERYSGIPVNEDITKFLYLEGPETGFEKFILSRPKLSDKPGEYFSYSSGDSNILMLILKKALPSSQDYDNWPWRELFDKLDLDVSLEQSSDGIFIGSSYLYARAYDYITLAKLIMNNGVYQGESLINTDFIKLFYKVAPGVGVKDLNNSSPHKAYSVQTTTNLPIIERADQSQYPNLALDTLFMLGYQGQFLAFSRSQDYLILRLSMDRGRAFEKNKLFPLIYRYLKIINRGFESSNDSLGIKRDYLPKAKKVIWDFANLHLAPKLLQRYAAKEICSCHFVLGRSLKQCSDDLKNGLPYIPNIEVNKKTKEIYASIIPGVFKSKAKLRSIRLGCYLPPSE